MYICVGVCAYMYGHRACLYACMCVWCVYMCVWCVYVCMYVRMYVHTHKLINFLHMHK